jgi:hypothetical protein
MSIGCGYAQTDEITYPTFQVDAKISWLEKLEEILKAAPPSIREFLDCFGSQEVVLEYFGLIDEYLPDHKQELTSLTLEKSLEKFIEYFSDDYFPIYESGMWEGVDDGLGYFIRYIPIQFEGFCSDDYDNSSDCVPALLLAEGVCENPYSSGERVSISEEFIKRFGENIADKIPAEGWKFADVEEALDKSPFKDFLIWCEWIFGQTGNAWMDTNEEDYSCEVEWDRASVDQLTEDWELQNKLRKRMGKFNQLMEKDPKAVATKIVNYLFRHITFKNERKPKSNLLINILNTGDSNDENKIKEV